MLTQYAIDSSSVHFHVAGGIGSSLSAQINETLFDELDHQVVRLSSQDVPTAYAYELEAATIVQSSQVIEAVERVCGKVAALV